MNEPESPTPRKPLGDALQWTDAEIESMSQITDKDIELAKRWWEKHAPENAKRLLDAKPPSAAENANPEKPIRHNYCHSAILFTQSIVFRQCFFKR